MSRTPSQANETIRHVGMGEVVGLPTGQAAILGLGSCVALALLEPGRSGAVLAHIVLPGTGGDLRYAQPAMEAAVAWADRLGLNPAVRLATVSGGARLLASAVDAVGPRTLDSVLTLLREQRIPVRTLEVGGRQARNVWVDAELGRVTVQALGAPNSV